MRSRPFKPLSTFVSLSLLIPAFVSAGETTGAPSPVSVSIDHSDGGRSSDRHMRKLLTELREKGCRTDETAVSSEKPAQLHFDPTPVSKANIANADYKLIARAISLSGASSMRGAILVHASTGIDDLAALQGQRIAFVSKTSPTGYLEAVKLLSDAGIEERWDTYFYVGNHVGSMSMLLHSDTDAAVVAEPLAQRWADYNDLSIVAVTDEVETGGWWMHKSAASETLHHCAKALESLNSDDLKALPAWIVGFTSVLPDLPEQ